MKIDRINFNQVTENHFFYDIRKNVFAEFTLNESDSEKLYNIEQKNKNELDLKLEKIKLILNSKNFKGFMSELNLNIDEEQLKNINIETSLDYYYLEDYDELKYNCKFIPNQLFDVLVNKNNEELVEIYRIENLNNEGVYEARGISIKSNLQDNNPAPSEDGDIKYIFPESRHLGDLSYSRKWYFGFISKSDINKWFYEKEDQEKMEKNSFYVSKYIVPKSFVVNGEKQVAFKMSEATLQSKKKYKAESYNFSISKLLNEKKEKNKIDKKKKLSL